MGHFVGEKNVAMNGFMTQFAQAPQPIRFVGVTYKTLKTAVQPQTSVGCVHCVVKGRISPSPNDLQRQTEPSALRASLMLMRAYATACTNVQAVITSDQLRPSTECRKHYPFETSRL